jgi:cytochrome d ubiquinol oxidase subunit I
MLTADGVSPSVGAGTVWISVTTFTVLYAALAIIELRLMLRYAKAGPQRDPVPATGADGNAAPDDDPDRPLVFAY